MSFPEVLNVEKYLNEAAKSTTGATATSTTSETSTTTTTTTSATPNLAESISAEAAAAAAAGSSTVEMSSEHLDEIEKAHQPDSSLDYELFSIMIHSGSATGGHYYAYIKSFENNQW